MRLLRLIARLLVFLAFAQPTHPPVQAVAVSLCEQVARVLLVFTLLVAPAATAERLACCVLPGMGMSAALAVAAVWGGLALSYWTDWPPSVGVTALSTGAYAAAPWWSASPSSSGRGSG